MLPYFQDLKMKAKVNQNNQTAHIVLNLCVVIKRRFSALYQGLN